MDADEILTTRAGVRGHHRHTSSHKSIPRRSTKGPLDLGDDPLSSGPSTPPPTRLQQSDLDVDSPSTSTILSSPASSRAVISPPPTSGAEVPVSHLAHLTRPGNFHPLPPSVTPLTLPPATTPLSELLASGHFRAAALLSARQLAAPPSSQAPLQASQILSLWHIRLASLCLLAFEEIASSESRALGDVIDGEIYRSPADGESIIPWGLRVLAVRLQARVDVDLNRAVIGMHVLAREARRRAGEAKDQSSSRQEWAQRLADLHVRVVSLLIEMGDLDGASRLLESSLKQEHSITAAQRGLLDARLILLLLHIGNVKRAKEILVRVEERSDDSAALMKQVVAAADGDYTASDTATPEDVASLQNLAVCKLYSGDMEGGRKLLSDATANGAKFPALVFNLTTMFELSTDRAKDLKADLGKNLAERTTEASLGVELSNADLKL